MKFTEYYGMQREPFVRNIPPQYLYASRQMKEGLARLKYTADNQQFAAVISEPGCGKSTLIRKFSSILSPDRYLLLYLSDSKMTPKWLYKNILDQLGLEAGFYRGDAKKLLQKQIDIISHKENRKVVCVLDEAHLLEKDTLEEFRFLLNSEFDSESNMALILVGQTELWDQKLRYQRYKAIRQRIDIMISLGTLDCAETGEYIRSNLDYAGFQGELLTEKAVNEIYKQASGIPREINNIIRKCLMFGAQNGQKIIDDHIVSEITQREFIGETNTL